jgi:hypothetical protein
MGAGWWLGRLAAPGRARPPVSVVRLHPEAGGVWVIGRDGDAAAIRDMKGLRYLRLLLQRPGVDLTALEMSDAVAGHPGTSVPEGDSAELVDRQALVAYQRRLTELDADLSEAEAWADAERRAALSQERQALLEQLSAATGLFGRQRRPAGASEKARIAVRKAIAAATQRISEVDPALGRLLRDSVSTGSACRYDPDPARPVRWILSASVNASSSAPVNVD